MRWPAVIRLQEEYNERREGAAAYIDEAPSQGRSDGALSKMALREVMRCLDNLDARLARLEEDTSEEHL